MIDATLATQIDAIARGWAEQWAPKHLFVGLAELVPNTTLARVTVALGGSARERVSRLTIELHDRLVTDVTPVEPLWPWRSDAHTDSLIEWVERCWPTVARLASERGAIEPVCTGMMRARRFWLVGQPVLYLCVEDLSRPVWAHRDATLCFTRSSRLLTDPASAWARLRAPRP